MRLPSVESRHRFFFSRVFIGIWETTSVAAGKNVRRTQGSLKKWSESLNKCEKSGKKAKYAVFCGSYQAARKCFERGRYMMIHSNFTNSPI